MDLSNWNQTSLYIAKDKTKVAVWNNATQEWDIYRKAESIKILGDEDTNSNQQQQVSTISTSEHY